MNLIDKFRVIRLADRDDRKKILALFALYAEADQHIRRFQKETGLQCVKGCGRCCENPNVEITVLELLPLAVELWRKKQGEDWLKKAEQAGLPGRCIFYQPDRLVVGKGRCQIYPFRPLVCRLFGFSAMVDKRQRSSLVTCSTIKEKYSQQFQRAQERIEKGLAAVKMAQYAFRVFHVDPVLGKDQLPINKAIKLALEKVGLKFKYQNYKRDF